MLLFLILTRGGPDIKQRREAVHLQIEQNQWIGKDGARSVTQYHDVMGSILGRWAKAIVMVRVCCEGLVETWA